MSAPGTHWKIKHEPQPAPCFHCATEPRLEGHVSCSSCHDEARCPKCHPGLGYVAPVDQSRGLLSPEHSRMRVGAE